MVSLVPLKERANQLVCRAALPESAGLVLCRAVQAHQLCLLNVASKRPRSYFQAKDRVLGRGGKMDPVSSQLVMALGSQSELFVFTGCLADALVEGSAQ